MADPLERLEIANIEGLTDDQKAMLRTLDAVVAFQVLRAKRDTGWSGGALFVAGYSPQEALCLTRDQLTASRF